MTTGDTAKAYKIISESFNFALDVVGMDKDSGPIWQEYINFIKTGPGIIGGAGWQDTQKMDALRAAYQKAIAVPTSALAPLWKEYDGFETGISKINVRRSIVVSFAGWLMKLGPQISAGKVTSVYDGENWLYTIAKYDSRPQPNESA
jgi:hypothetical protein